MWVVGDEGGTGFGWKSGLVIYLRGPGMPRDLCHECLVIGGDLRSLLAGIPTRSDFPGRGRVYPEFGGILTQNLETP